MDLSRESMEFLAHFDGPTALCFDRETPDSPGSDEPSGTIELTNPAPLEIAPAQVLNTAWVLGRAAVLATLFLAASMLIDFGYGMMTETTLSRAARAGALEATLPRATRETIESTIARRLVEYPAIERQLRLGVHQNGKPSQGELTLQQGDRVLVTLTVPRNAASPQWISRLNFWRKNALLQAQAERVVPGRLLARRSN